MEMQRVELSISEDSTPAASDSVLSAMSALNRFATGSEEEEEEVLN